MQVEVVADLLLEHLLLVEMVVVVLVLVTLLKILEEVEVLRMIHLQVVLELPVLFSSLTQPDKYLKT